MSAARPRMRRIALVPLFALAVAGCSGAPQDSGAATAATPLPTPAPTASPAPPPWTPAQRAELTQTLGATLDAGVLQDGAGLAVVSADGTTLFAHRAGVPLAPASTLKLIVAASALNAYGPQHRFTTRFVALAPPDEGGELHGPLWLVGGGDPLLTSTELRAGVGALVRAGVTRIDGPVILDDTAFSGPGVNPHWESDDLDEAYAAPTSAFSLDGNTIEFHVTPGASGEPALVTIEPPNDLVRLDRDRFVVERFLCNDRPRRRGFGDGAETAVERISSRRPHRFGRDAKVLEARDQRQRVRARFAQANARRTRHRVRRRTRKRSGAAGRAAALDASLANALRNRRRDVDEFEQP
jgi:D-alanyl-D-alanine carboxypeptidase